MKVTDYIVEFIISKGITDVFGYPGGVICHFIDSVTKYPKLNAHINYHEQASAFAACGYAQETGKIGVAYSTSGPGATNLITGIANAYFDSVPVMFLTGQVDTYALKGTMPIRQNGFQETDIVNIVKPIVKYAVRVDNPQHIIYELENAYRIATSGNPGPVLIDLPADVQRAEIDILEVKQDYPLYDDFCDDNVNTIVQMIEHASRPCFLVGNGVKQSGLIKEMTDIIHNFEIPCVFSMPAFDTLPYEDNYNFGFIGANGHRYANFVLGKSDLIISLGSRLDLKQVGNNREQFAPNARIIRIDIDANNFANTIHKDDICLCSDLKKLLSALKGKNVSKVSREWLNVCNEVKNFLKGYDDENYTSFLNRFCEALPDDISITTDVGQSEVWVAQQFHIKNNQCVHMSAGHGAMGYSLPAAIGSYYGNGKRVISFNGDGGLQMNIQELQFLSREQIPVHVVVINNRSLGMIRGFQEANFDKNYSQTIEGTGYSAPDFGKIAYAYGIQYLKIEDEKDICSIEKIDIDRPSIIELVIPCETYLNPNFGRNGFIQDQRPYIDRDLYDRLMKL